MSTGLCFTYIQNKNLTMVFEWFLVYRWSGVSSNAPHAASAQLKSFYRPYSLSQSAASILGPGCPPDTLLLPVQPTYGINGESQPGASDHDAEQREVLESCFICPRFVLSILFFRREALIKTDLILYVPHLVNNFRIKMNTDKINETKPRVCWLYINSPPDPSCSSLLSWSGSESPWSMQNIVAAYWWTVTMSDRQPGSSSQDWTVSPDSWSKTKMSHA